MKKNIPIMGTGVQVDGGGQGITAGQAQGDCDTFCDMKTCEVKKI